MKFDRIKDAEVILDIKKPTPIVNPTKVPNTDWTIGIHYYKNKDQLLIRLNLEVISKDMKYHLEKYFGSLYQLHSKLDLFENLNSESLKLVPIFRDLINAHKIEIEKLSIEYAIPKLTNHSVKTLARKIVDTFNYSSDVSG